MARTEPILRGKPRTLGGGARAWSSALYAPTAKYHLHRLTFKELSGESWSWTTRTAATLEDARKLWEQVELALDSHGKAPAKVRVQRTQTLAALGELYVSESRKDKAQVRTIEGRESKLRAHIVPAAGDVPVSQWDLDLTRTIMEKAGKTVLTPAGLSDVRSVLSAMRSLAWREGWLHRGVDPLDGYKSERIDPSATYVEAQMRPGRHQVDAMARAADHLTTEGPEQLRRLPLLGLKIRTAGYGGLRLGEQNACRAIDVDFLRGVLNVNGSWTQPRTTDAQPFRGPVKNRRRHDAPLPASIMAALLPRCAVLMGLPADATVQQVINAINAERIRRGRQMSSPTDWWKAPMEPAKESWIFIDTWTGLPVRTELHNDRWHKIRRWVDKNDPDHAWPQYIVYRNLRHHAATFWSEELDRPWVDVAAYLGDTLAVVLAHYVRPGADALAETVEQLKQY